MKPGLRALIYLIVFAFVLQLTGCPLVDKLSGASGKDPEKFFTQASPQALALVKRAWRDMPGGFAYDVHVHALGDNEKENGSFINPSSKTVLKLTNYLKMQAYLSAGRVKDIQKIDQQYINHLVKLARNCGHPIRLYLLAFDKHYDRAGNAVLSKTDFYVPNDYVMKLSRTYPDVFVPVISVHPYRRNAIAELEKWAAQGVRIVKWIPSVQGIDPADAAIIPFYRAMKRLDMVLLTHSGEEFALDTHGQKHLDNPLRLRRPLDSGLKVIMAHCASAGKNPDPEHPEKGKVHNFDLFLRLMSEKQYEGLLFADISGTLQVNRMDKTLPTLLGRKDLHPRLLNGSDYPLPAVNVLISTGKLVKKGYITRNEKKALQEIYDYNPLLFDFVLKRIIRLPKSSRTFPPSLFQNNPFAAN